MKTEKLQAKLAKLKTELQDLLDANPDIKDRLDKEKVEQENEILQES